MRNSFVDQLKNMEIFIMLTLYVDMLYVSIYSFFLLQPILIFYNFSINLPIINGIFLYCIIQEVMSGEQEFIIYNYILSILIIFYNYILIYNSIYILSAKLYTYSNNVQSLLVFLCSQFTSSRSKCSLIFFFLIFISFFPYHWLKHPISSLENSFPSLSCSQIGLCN